MEQATGGKGENAMSKKITYTDKRLAMGERVTDFLPPPAMALGRRLLVDTDPPHDRPHFALPAPRDRALHQPPRFIPADP